MSKKIQLFLLLVLSFAWFACKKVDIQFGTQFIDNDYTQVVKVDSFTADVATVYVDSFLTSGSGVTILGGYTDPVFGKVKNDNYFDLYPPTINVDSFANTTFDSLALLLVPDKSYYGDTTQTVHIEVNRLAEPIVGYDDNKLIIYNTQHFAVISPTIGSANAIFRPVRADSIKIRLDDNLGKELLRKMQDPNDIDLRTNDAFVQYFYGLRLSAGTSNPNVIFGCKDSVVMRLYYKKPGLYLQGKTIDFTLAVKNHHFNNITVDRSGTVLQNIATTKLINSTQLGNMAYSSYAMGVMTKIRFPTVRDVLKLTNYVKLVKATLIVRPVISSYPLPYVLPPQLRLSSTTQLNLLGTDLTALVGGTVSTQTGNLFIDGLYGQDTNYSYDVSGYVKTLINDGSINQNGVLLVPPSPALITNFNRVIVGNKFNVNGKMELQLVYAAVQSVQ